MTKTENNFAATERETIVVQIDKESFDALTKKVDDMHRALLGDEYGNHGFKQRLENVEKKTQNFEKKGWMVYGGSLAVGFLISKWKSIAEIFTQP